MADSALNGDFPTLAEYLGSRGYATARVSSPIRSIAPMETGLDRGFAHYEDYLLEGLMAFSADGVAR